MNKIRCNFRKFSAILALSVIVVVVLPLKACAKEPEPAGIIIMTTKARELSLAVVVAGDVSIDWGDGKKSNVNDSFHFDEVFERFWFTHEYSGTTEHNIAITGNVKKMFCSSIGLTALDVSKNTALTDLYCNQNQLITLDLSRNTMLTDLYCDQNQLTALDVSKNTALESLECNWNHLTRLDVSKNKALKILSCVGNQFTVSALNDLFGTLPDYSKTDHVAAIYISERNPNAVSNPATLDCDRSIAEKRGWHFRTLR